MIFALVAQLVEQLTFNQLVRGSSPRGCTNLNMYKTSNLDYNIVYV